MKKWEDLRIGDEIFCYDVIKKSFDKLKVMSEINQDGYTITVKGYYTKLHNLAIFSGNMELNFKRRDDGLTEKIYSSEFEHIENYLNQEYQTILNDMHSFKMSEEQAKSLARQFKLIKGVTR